MDNNFFDDLSQRKISDVVIRDLERLQEEGLPLTTPPPRVTVPPPPVFPVNMGPFLTARYIASAYLEAVAWTEFPAGAKRPDDRLRYEVQATLKKRPDFVEAVRVALVSLRDEEESRLSPVMWAWWRIASSFERRPEAGLLGVVSVFNPEKLLDKRLRAIFWRTGMARVSEERTIYPLAAKRLREVQAEFRQLALDSPTLGKEDLTTLWDLCYRPQYNQALDDANKQVLKIKAAVQSASEKLKLGLWLSDDVVRELKLRRFAMTEE